MNYWKECVESAFDEAGLLATQKQIESISECVRLSHENYGLYTGEECIPNPLEIENKRLRRELRIESDKVTCSTCKGRGSITEAGPVHFSVSRCCDCNGEGKRLL